MFSSAKFLSPIVTAGLPTPGPLAAGACALTELELELDEDLLLPQAPSTTLATSTTSAARARPLWWFQLLRSLPAMRRLPMLVSGCGSRGYWARTGERFSEPRGRATLAREQAQAARRERPLREG